MKRGSNLRSQGLCSLIAPFIDILLVGMLGHYIPLAVEGIAVGTARRLATHLRKACYEGVSLKAEGFLT